jgi:acetyl/propionyl-CoA carboxylase alpha subunit
VELRKKYIVRTEDRETVATLVRDGSGRVWVETSDGQRIDDAIVLDGGRTVSVRLDGRMYLVDLTARTDTSLRALVNGKGGLVHLYDELGAAAADVDAGGRGQPLLVLEAMKMQNELASPGDGVVEEILVSAGQSVESNVLLVRLAESDD